MIAADRNSPQANDFAESHPRCMRVIKLEKANKAVRKRVAYSNGSGSARGMERRTGKRGTWVRDKRRGVLTLLAVAIVMTMRGLLLDPNWNVGSGLIALTTKADLGRVILKSVFEGFLLFVANSTQRDFLRSGCLFVVVGRLHGRCLRCTLVTGDRLGGRIGTRRDRRRLHRCIRSNITRPADNELFVCASERGDTGDHGRVTIPAADLPFSL